MNAPELKPCPFCGCPTHSQKTVTDTAVWCVGCGAEIVRLHYTGSTVDWDATPRVIAAWNRRADLYDAQAAEIADLRRQLAEARDRTTEQIVQQAAKDARDVFSDAQDAREAVDYMEQLIYAAIRNLKGAAK